METSIPMPEIKIDKMGLGTVTATMHNTGLVRYAEQHIFVDLLRAIVQEFARMYVEKNYDAIASQVNTKQIADEVAKMLMERFKEEQSASPQR